MAAGEANWRLTKSFASRLGAHLPVIEQIVGRMQSLGWGDKDLFGVQLALEESLTNAVKHGNKLDQTKMVHVECELSSTRFWAHICDEGDGFLPSEVPDPTDDDHLTAIGGRGLLLMKAYMTDVSYNDSGNCVTLLKIRQHKPN